MQDGSLRDGRRRVTSGLSLGLYVPRARGDSMPIPSSDYRALGATLFE